MRPFASQVLAVFLDTLLKALPPSALLALCDGVGVVAWGALPGRRAVALENLRLTFEGEMSDAQRRRIARAGFRHMARLVGEWVLAERLLASPRQRARRVRLHGAWRELEHRMRGTGGVLVTGHLGNWEVGAHVARAHGMRLRPMYRPPRSALAQTLLRRWRAGGNEAFPKVGGLREALRHVAGGGWLGLLADQNAGRHGTFVPFLGVAASTFPTPVVLALRLGTPVYLGVCLRAPGSGLGFDAWIEELTLPHAQASGTPVPKGGLAEPSEARVRAGVEALNQALERHIRREPGQYHWAHRRYKLRPAGARPGPDQPFYGRFAVPPAASRAARSPEPGSGQAADRSMG